MSLINGTRLTKLRARVNNQLPGTAILYSPTLAPDGYGGVTKTYAAAGTVSCRVVSLQQSTASRVEQSFGAETIQELYKIDLPHDVTIAPDWQVVTGGVTYQIEQLSLAHDWRVSCWAIMTRVR